MYRCAECGASVEVKDGIVERTCGHNDAGIIADMASKLEGSGGLEA